jgi:hypothetical protein
VKQPVTHPKRRMDVGPPLQGLHLPPGCAPHDLVGRAAEHALSGDDVVGERGQGEDIGPGAEALGVALFGRRIPHGADGGAHAERGRHAAGAGHTEVGHFGQLVVAVPTDEHVRGLEIAVNHPRFVQRLQTEHEAADEAAHPLGRKGVAGLREGVLDALFQVGPARTPMHVLEGEPRDDQAPRALELSAVEETHDIRGRRDTLGEPGQGHRLLLEHEPGGRGVGADERLAEHLHDGEVL